MRLQSASPGASDTESNEDLAVDALATPPGSVFVFNVFSEDMDTFSVNGRQVGGDPAIAGGGGGPPPPPRGGGGGAVARPPAWAAGRGEVVKRPPR
ncbi:hypothetical protein, partial [Rhodopseudomonas sp. BAL398]|uniref:hypothetical protein n=1 Tax=Rhodopseudomonas sp. BAL398 TaxID=3034676 RepID=UPI0023E2EAD6